MKIIVDYGLLRFIEVNKCPEVQLDDWGKKHFKRIIDFSSIDIDERPLKGTYLAFDYNGYGYPFSCGKDQIKQALEIVMANLK